MRSDGIHESLAMVLLTEYKHNKILASGANAEG